MGWHRNYAEELTDLHNEMKALLEERDLEIAELKAEIERLRGEVNQHHPVYSAEVEDYKRMHPVEE